VRVLRRHHRRANTHHPVRAYLAGLEWDGVPRLSLWLTTYLGAYDAPPEYVHAVGRAWLISLVARAMRPGCQVDHLLILEGPQGARKSSALRALVPDPAWFTDNISPSAPRIRPRTCAASGSSSCPTCPP
jgi:putative DNA primase/helicase